MHALELALQVCSRRTACAGPFGALVQGEVAPYCQPPYWLCNNRDLLAFLAVQTDQIIFPQVHARSARAGAHTECIPCKIRQAP